MIYLANPSTPAVREAMVTNPWLGAMVTASQGNSIPPGVSMGVDNECFTQPEAFGKGEAFEAKLLRFSPAQVLFANAPDVVGDWDETLDRSGPWLLHLAALGYPPAIVLQDGATVDTVPWAAIEAVFIGGTTEWKLSPDAAELAQAARRRGKWVHMGRVNSLKRLRCMCKRDGRVLHNGRMLSNKRL